MRTVLVVRTGAAPSAVAAAHGDFPAWFAERLAPAAAAVVVEAGPDAPKLPPAHGRGPLPGTRFDGVVVTGSLASVTRPLPWMDALGAWLLEAAREVPVLGVCFGHQLLGHALGVRVERNPRGPEAGTCEVVLTPAGRTDPLFAGLPSPLAVQQSHEDHVPALPPGAVLLATNAHAPVQAFAHGPRVRAVQFHPEFDAARNRAFVAFDRADLELARPGLAGEAEASLRETPEAARVIANWVAGFVVGRG